jgi:hypothetical protein
MPKITFDNGKVTVEPRYESIFKRMQDDFCAYMKPSDPPYTMTDYVIDASIKAMIDKLDTVLEEE